MNAQPENKNLSLWEWVKNAFSPENLPGLMGAVFAFLVMLMHPLIYDDFFFNINRYKYACLCWACLIGFIVYTLLTINRIRHASGGGRDAYLPFLADAGVVVLLIVAVAVATQLEDKTSAVLFIILACFSVYMFFALLRRRQETLFAFRPTLADISMLFFVLTAFVSCLLSDDVSSAFTGDEGRRSGLVFILCVGAIHVIVARSPKAGKYVVRALLISGALCALLGILNFFKIDPLGFYNSRLKEADHRKFIATIGNIDFFTAFLCLYLPAAAAHFVASDSPFRFVDIPFVIIGAGALIAARTDGAMLAVFGSVFFALYFGMGGKRQLTGCFAALAAMFLGFAAMGILMLSVPESGYLSVKGSVMRYAAEYPFLMVVLASVMVLAAVIVNLFVRVKEKPRNIAFRKKLVLFTGIVLAAVILILFFYFSVIDTESELSGPMNFLRFQDTWGTHRGGVWTRCLKLYSESDLRVKLVGFGPDLLKKPLADAYGKEIAAYSNLSFDNAHNELIQYLLTQGALGLISYLAFVGFGMYNLFVRMKHCPCAAAAFAAAATYLVHSVVTVNQPITTPLLFLLLSAGVSCRPKAQRCPSNMKKDGDIKECEA